MKKARSNFFASAGFVLALYGLGCAPATETETSSWNRFRGPNGAGVADDAPLPTTWDASENRRWATPLPGFGRSSPVVAGGRVYVANAEREGKQLKHGLVALDADTGELLWQTTLATRRELQLRNRFGVHSGATPAVDGDRIFAYYGAELAALDPAGEVVWNVIVEPDYEETTRYGAGSSPIVVDDAVIVLQDKEYARPDYDVGFLAAFDRESGAELWRTEFSDGCCSYVTPVVRRTEAGAEIIVALSRKVVAFSVEDGSVLWEDDQNMNQPVASPVLSGDLLCVASGAHNVRETVCRRLTGAGANTQIEPLWRTHTAVGESASPLLYDGQLYVLVQKGVVTAYEAETGTVRFRKRLPSGAYLASLVAGDGKVYAYNNAGVTAVLGSGPAFEQLAVNDLGERGSIATPALAGGRIYLRTAKNLVCIEGAAPASAAASS